MGWRFELIATHAPRMPEKLRLSLHTVIGIVALIVLTAALAMLFI
jgi:hypothetical protein